MTLKLKAVDMTEAARVIILALNKMLSLTIFSKATLIAAVRKDFDQAYAWICFAGSGTVGVVAAQLRRDYILIDLQPDYIKMAEERLKAVEAGVPVKEARAGQLSLLENVK